jgi:hypothetical protein
MDHQLVDKYNNLNWTSLTREDLGSYNIVNIEVVLKHIKSIFDSIIQDKYSNTLSRDLLDQVERRLREFLNICSRIQGFQNMAERGELIESVKKFYSELLNQFGVHYLSLIEDEKKNFHAILRSAQRELDKKSAEFDERMHEILQKSKEFGEHIRSAEESISHIKKRAQEKEVEFYGNFFEKTAKNNKEDARLAFWLMIASIILTAFTAVIYVQNINITSESFSGIFKSIQSQNILIKIILLSLGVFLISHFSKEYSAEKHLYVLNTQRQNALNSHRQILRSIQKTESQNDLETQNAILLQVTRAIFDNQNTGYLKDGVSPMPTSQVLEITKTLQK